MSGPAWPPGRRLAVATLACAGGAGLALWCASRVWRVTLEPGVAPLPAREVAATGVQVMPWLAALAWVALAGAGALLATRGVGRLVVGGLLVVAGAGILATGVSGVVLAAGGDAGRDGAGWLWPVLAALCGAVVAAVGVLTLRTGRSWPVMGARYERTRPPTAAGGTGLWDALDRGEDPTVQG